MNTQQTPTILIAYPENFLCYRKFERKVSIILSNLSKYHLAYVNDYNNFISQYLSTDTRADEQPTHLDGEDIENITHAIIFNDGQSYLNLIRTAKEAGIKARIIDTVTTKVINIERGGKYDVYIGRGSVFGNPYAIGFSGDREEVIRKFKYDFEREFLRFTKKDVLKLKGKTLGCHCKPAACHGDVIAEYLNSLDDGS